MSISAESDASSVIDDEVSDGSSAVGDVGVEPYVDTTTVVVRIASVATD